MLMAILGLGVIYRLVFFIGFDGFDDVMYANSAQALTQGRANISITHGAGRIGHYGPLSLIYLVFGPSLTSTLAWPFFCSLVTIVLVYLIAKQLANETAGVLAALVFTLLPVATLTATVNMPDVPMTMLNAAAVYAFLLAGKHKGRRAIGLYVLCGILLAWGLFANQRTVLTAGVLVGWTLFEYLGERLTKTILRAKYLIGAGLLMGLVFYGASQSKSFSDALATTAADIFYMLSSGAFFYSFLPLLMIVLVLALRKPIVPKFAIAWFTVLFLALEWWPMSIDPMVYMPAPLRPISPRGILFLMLPAAVLVGICLSKLTDRAKLNRSLFLVCGFLGFLVLTLHLEWWPRSVVLAGSALGILVFIALSLQLPRRLGDTGVANTAYLSLLLFFMGISAINPLQKQADFAYGLQAYFSNFEQTAQLLEKYPHAEVYFAGQEDTRPLSILNFVSGYRLAPDPFDEVSGRMNVLVDANEVQPDSLIVVLARGALSQVAPTWQQIAYFTQPANYVVANPPEVFVFRAVPSGEAAEALVEAQAQYLEEQTNERLADVLSAAVRANELDIAFNAYLELRGTGHADLGEHETQVLRLIRSWFEQGKHGENLVENGDFGAGLTGWDVSQADAIGIELIEPVDPDGGLLMRNRTGQQSLAISQRVELEPNTAYVFAADLRTEGEIAPLYWWSGDEEAFYDEVGPPDDVFVRLHFAFITPDWDAPMSTLVSPAFLLGDGDTWVGDIVLAKVVGANE